MYCILFHYHPMCQNNRSYSLGSAKSQALQGKVNKRLGKGVVAMVKSPRTRNYSRLSVQKASGGWRSVVSNNLSSPHQLCHPHRVQDWDSIFHGRNCLEGRCDVLHSPEGWLFSDSWQYLQNAVNEECSNSLLSVSAFPQLSRSSLMCSLWCWSGLTGRGFICIYLSAWLVIVEFVLTSWNVVSAFFGGAGNCHLFREIRPWADKQGSASQTADR